MLHPAYYCDLIYRKPKEWPLAYSTLTSCVTGAKFSERRLDVKPAYLIGDTFVVQSNGSYIAYSPVSGKIARVSSFPEESSSVFASLQKAGLFGPLLVTTKRDDVDVWLGFQSLTFLTTRSCNLACIYCYAAAESCGRTMDQKLALKALDWFVKQLRGKTIRITFHGGGEPTLAYSLIQEVVSAAERLADLNEKKTRFQIVTNGTADQSVIDWLIGNNFGISVSADGSPHIQDRNRPFVDGSPSSGVVEWTICYLVSLGYPFTVRLTFSPVDNIEEIVRYFGGLRVKSLHLEPLFPHGRNYGQVAFGEKSDARVYSPNGNELAKAFFRAMEVARECGIRINNSHIGHLMKGTGYFCGSARGRSMVVTDDGFISGCLEVVDSKDPDFESFRLGHFSVSRGSFHIDRTALSRFQGRHGSVLPYCRECFARYICGGGCAVKSVRASGDFMGRDMPYCAFTKTLIPIIIERLADLSGI